MMSMPSIDDFKMYAHPPIVEAVYEIRFAIVEEKRVDHAVSEVIRRYKNSKAERLVEAKLDFDKREALFVDASPNVTLTSEDETERLHITNKNIFWSKLAPYGGWSQFRGRVEPELQKALKALGQPSIQRRGLRYSNRIDVPSEDGLHHYERYIAYHLNTDALLEPQASFLWRVVKDFPEYSLQAMIECWNGPSVVPGHGAVYFGIDVFSSAAIDSASEALLSELDKMRELKNLIFEASITDKARAMFDDEQI